MIDPPVIRPGGGTSPRIDNAVTDLPLPDSPTRASVSPARIMKLTPRTAAASWSPRLKTVVSPSTCSRIGLSPACCLLPPASVASALAVLTMFTEHGAKRVGDLAHGGPRLDCGDDGRDQIRPVSRGSGDAVECPSHVGLVT